MHLHPTFGVRQSEQNRQMERAVLAYQRTGDNALRDAIAASHDALVERFSRRLMRSSDSYDDIVQGARLALLDSIDDFDASRGIPFRTHAMAAIKAELSDQRYRSWALHVPRRTQDLFGRVSRITDVLTVTLNRSPTVAELADEMHVDPEEVLEALEAGRSLSPASIDLVRLTPEDVAAEAVAVDIVDVGCDDDFDRAIRRDELRTLLAGLPPRQQAILYLLFFEEQTQAAIARRMGVSQVHVSRLERQAFDVIRRRARPS